MVEEPWSGVSKPRFLVVGDVFEDIVVRPDGPVNPDADTPSAIEVRPGGSAANTAAWLTCLGADVTFVPTARGTIVVLVEGERRTMFTQRSRIPDAVVPGSADFTHVHLTGYSLLDDIGAVQGLLPQAHAQDVSTSLTVGTTDTVRRAGAGLFSDLAPYVDLLFVNADEADALTGVLSAFRTVIITDGPRGARVIEHGTVTVHPTTPVTPVDPTGAGDAFVAGYLVTGSIERAHALATECLALVGGRPDHRA